jgi:cation diffusion facilitator CzcD-associated flavoprotein CzcO
MGLSVIIVGGGIAGLAAVRLLLKMFSITTT